MNAAPTNLLRRNFALALAGHATLVATLFIGERWMPDFTKAPVENIQLIVPGDIIGDLPQGPGHGKGAYTPPPPASPDTPHGNDTPAVTPTPSDETVSPPTPPASHDEIGIPSKLAKKPVKLPPVATPLKKAPTKPGNPTSTNTGTAKGPSADQIRQRFLNALRGNGTEGGSIYGDNRPPGGGTGKSKTIGSPDGSPDGIPGGTDPGTPFWQYYLHVHDRMYEAWDQPASLTDRKLVTIVIIKVARDGNIVGVALKHSSGNKLMDNSAITAARKVQMLEPPPDALMKGAAAEISVDFQMEG